VTANLTIPTLGNPRPQRAPEWARAGRGGCQVSYHNSVTVLRTLRCYHRTGRVLEQSRRRSPFRAKAVPNVKGVDGMSDIVAEFREQRPFFVVEGVETIGIDDKFAVQRPLVL